MSVGQPKNIEAPNFFIDRRSQSVFPNIAFTCEEYVLAFEQVGIENYKTEILRDHILKELKLTR